MIIYIYVIKEIKKTSQSSSRFVKPSKFLSETHHLSFLNSRNRASGLRCQRAQPCPLPLSWCSALPNLDRPLPSFCNFVCIFFRFWLLQLGGYGLRYKITWLILICMIGHYEASTSWLCLPLVVLIREVYSTPLLKSGSATISSIIASPSRRP